MSRSSPPTTRARRTRTRSSRRSSTGVAGRPPRPRHWSSPTGAAPSPWRSIGPGPGDLVVIAGKGHEQGSGVRGRPEDPVRRPRRGPRGAGGPVIELAAGADRPREAGAEIVGYARGRRRRPDGRPGPSSTPARSRDGDLFFGLPGGAASTAAIRRRGARSRAPGGSWSLRERAAGLIASGPTRRDGSSRPPTRCSPCSRWPAAGDGRSDAHWSGSPGSTGKTSAKDICRAILPARVHASPENFNTEIGMPLALLAAPPETEMLVMEMAMRGIGQIAELCEIAEPDVAAITNVGPVHLELLGTLEAIVEAKAEILQGLARPWPGGAARRCGGAEAAPAATTSRSSPSAPGGDVFALSAIRSVRAGRGTDRTPAGRPTSSSRSRRSHNLTNALCAIAIGVSLDGPRGDGDADLTDRVLAPARRTGRAPRADLAAQRLLQRESDLDARRGREPGDDDCRPRRRGRRPRGRGPRRDGRARPRPAPTSTPRSAPWSVSAGSDR